ncbi:DDE superfamily endonuclease, partial [Rhizoctonia solani AG-3 Rhs1AP]
MDEKGFRIGEMGSEKVIIMRHNPDWKDGYAGGSKQSGDWQTVTSIDCICADGTVLPPMIIMKGKTVQKPWLENSPLPVGTRWAASPNGWTDNELGLSYIKAFDEWTTEKSSDGQWRCLILDGHGSHLTYEFLQYAHDARIIIVGLPSHTTDFLQPLDCVIFRVLQRFYGHAVDDQARNMLTVNKQSFAEWSYMKPERKPTLAIGSYKHSKRQESYLWTPTNPV